jgi:ABC-type multidrug transport system fused ATPase/permease subunit
MFIKKIKFLIQNKKNELFKLLIFYCFASLLEALSLGIVYPFVLLITKKDTTVILNNKIGLNLNSNQLLMFSGLILVVFFFFKSIYLLYVNKKVIEFSMMQLKEIRMKLMRNFQTQNYLNYINKNSANFQNNIQNLSYNYSINFLLPLIRMFGDLFVGFIIIIILFLIDWKTVSILIFLILSLILFYDKIYGKLQTKFGIKANNSQKKLIHILREAVYGFKEIRSLGKEQYFFDKVKDTTEIYCYTQSKSQLYSIIPRYLVEFILILFLVLVIFLTNFYTGDFLSILSVLSVFGIASIRLLPISNSISYGISQARYGKDVVNVLYDELNSKLEPVFEKISIIDTLPQFKSIEFKELYFYYPNSNRNILENVNFKINAGTITGIAGPSGSGKTTLIDILLGYLLLTNGKIIYNNTIDITNNTIFFDKIAYIPQSNFILDETILHNITFSNNLNDIDSNLLNTAITLSSLDDVIANSKNGLNTYVGENGANFSGGQRQRISLARAIYQNKEIIILDEATSALDNKTEMEVINSLVSLKGIKTIILITHRPESLMHCDNIINLK